jgi:hypothetical protein
MILLLKLLFNSDAFLYGGTRRSKKLKTTRLIWFYETELSAAYPRTGLNTGQAAEVLSVMAVSIRRAENNGVLRDREISLGSCRWHISA